MSLNSKLLTKSSHAAFFTLNTFTALEMLPYNTAEDSYEEEAYLHSGYGTLCAGVLYPKRPIRVVAPKPRKPVARKVSRPRSFTKIQWPDARNAKEVAAFYEECLGAEVTTPLGCAGNALPPTTMRYISLEEATFKHRLGVSLPNRGPPLAMNFGRGFNGV